MGNGRRAARRRRSRRSRGRGGGGRGGAGGGRCRCRCCCCCRAGSGVPRGAGPRCCARARASPRRRPSPGPRPCSAGGTGRSASGNSSLRTKSMRPEALGRGLREAALLGDDAARARCVSRRERRARTAKGSSTSAATADDLRRTRPACALRVGTSRSMMRRKSTAIAHRRRRPRRRRARRRRAPRAGASRRRRGRAPRDRGPRGCRGSGRTSGRITSQRAARAQHAERAERRARAHQAQDLLEHARRRRARELAARARTSPAQVRVLDAEAQARGELDRAQDAHRVLGHAHARVADRAQHARPRGRRGRRRSRGSRPRSGSRNSALIVKSRRRASSAGGAELVVLDDQEVVVGLVVARGGSLRKVAVSTMWLAVGDVHQPEAPADDAPVAEQALDLPRVRARWRRRSPSGSRPSKQVAHAAADQVGLVAVALQARDHAQRVLVERPAAGSRVGRARPARSCFGVVIAFFQGVSTGAPASGASRAIDSSADARSAASHAGLRSAPGAHYASRFRRGRARPPRAVAPIGRATDSKSVGSGFESLLPCQTHPEGRPRDLARGKRWRTPRTTSRAPWSRHGARPGRDAPSGRLRRARGRSRAGSAEATGSPRWTPTPSCSTPDRGAHEADLRAALAWAFQGEEVGAGAARPLRASTRGSCSRATGA